MDNKPLRNNPPTPSEFRSLAEERLKQKQTEEELYRLNRALLVTNQCNQVLIHTTDEMALLQKVCSIMVEIGGYRMAWVGYAETDEAKSIRPVAQAGFEQGYLKLSKFSWADTALGQGPTGTTIRTGHPITIRDIQRDPKFMPWHHEASKRGYASIQSLPLKVDNAVFGAITIYSAIQDAFNAEETKLLNVLADNLSYGITTLRTRKAHELAEEGLIKQQKRFTQALEAANAGTWEVDLKTGESVWSDEIWKMFGLERGTATPTMDLWVSIIYPEERTMIIKAIAEAAKKESPINLEYHIIHPDGKVRWMMVRGMLIQDRKADSMRYIGTCIDITERKLLEEDRANLQLQLQQKQKMQLVGQLAGGIAHDFNNMLTVILGHTEMAIARKDSSYEDLQAIKKAATHSAELTRQLLTFARQQTFETKVLDLNATIAEMLSILRRLIGDNITLTWIPKAKSALVRLNPSLINQILANLCINARDAIDGNGNIIIETAQLHVDQTESAAGHPCTIPGDYVILTITDNGRGIEKKHLPRIFEPFFTTKELGKGTGMGLATVYGIVSQCNGFIDVKSEKGKGTTIIICLPLELHGTAAEPTEKAEPSMPHGKGSILLVEDQPDILQLCKQMLDHSGYHVLPALRPLQAIQLAEQYKEKIELLVTDVIMPEMNGHVLFRKLQRVCPQLKVLYMSGYTADFLDNHIASDKGVNFIEKPFSMNAFTNAIQKALKPNL